MRGSSTGGGEQINRQPGAARGIKILTGGREGEVFNYDFCHQGRGEGEGGAGEEQFRTRLEVPLTC